VYNIGITINKEDKDDKHSFSYGSIGYCDSDSTGSNHVNLEDEMKNPKSIHIPPATNPNRGQDKHDRRIENRPFTTLEDVHSQLNKTISRIDETISSINKILER
jgi:hypothetical protein